jgi:hypothetical protein
MLLAQAAYSLGRTQVRHFDICGCDIIFSASRARARWNHEVILKFIDRRSDIEIHTDLIISMSLCRPDLDQMIRYQKTTTVGGLTLMNGLQFMAE